VRLRFEVEERCAYIYIYLNVYITLVLLTFVYIRCVYLRYIIYIYIYKPTRKADDACSNIDFVSLLLVGIVDGRNAVGW